MKDCAAATRLCNRPHAAGHVQVFEKQAKSIQARLVL
jgi:hypothetical protein